MNKKIFYNHHFIFGLFVYKIKSIGLLFRAIAYVDEQCELRLKKPMNKNDDPLKL